ncbi:MerR family transcriptional regulator [bacterium]|nr:MerR family transcriptional regulator [bacterium]
MTTGNLPKREILKELAITDRLLKYWVGWYKLAINRRGRGSTYPSGTVESLRLIKRLSDSRYFTMRFIRDLLSARGADDSAVDGHLTFCRNVLKDRPAVPTVSSEEKRVSARSAPAAVTAAPSKRMGEDLL